MADLTPDIVAEVVETCKLGAEEAAAAFGRALDTEVQLSVGEPGTVKLESLPGELTGPGLAIALSVGGGGAIVLVPESSGLLPTWYAEPDPTGESKLATLAQEWGMILLPEQYMPEDFKAAKVDSLPEAIVKGGVGEGAASLSIQLTKSGSEPTSAYLIWPASDPTHAYETDTQEPPTEAKPESESAKNPQAKTEPTPQPRSQPAAEPRKVTKPSVATRGTASGRGRVTSEDLPDYTLSLLRIKLPVVVTLARKRQPLQNVVELRPGSIIQFEKSCEEMLELDVAGHSIATGEAVKVGDKFGLRINAMILPEERFVAVRNTRNR